MDTFGENPVQINIKKEDGGVQIEFTANGAPTSATVKTPNIIAKNGIIHEVDNILLETPTPAPTGDLIEVATNLKNFTRILKAIADLKLTEKFKAIGAATVFAPSDAVFAELEKENPKIIENLTDEQKLALISR